MTESFGRLLPKTEKPLTRGNGNTFSSNWVEMLKYSSHTKKEKTMKYKVGDKVRVRSWGALMREFGASVDGSPKLPCFVNGMKEFCGTVLTISNISSGSYYDVLETYFIWNDSCFEGYAFEYGDEIEVSDDETEWVTGNYMSYTDGTHFPYRVCVEDFTEKAVHSGVYKYARPIAPAKPTCEGKTVEIDGVKYKLTLKD